MIGFWNAMPTRSFDSFSCTISDRTTKKGAPEVGAAVGQKMTKLGLWAQLATMASFGGVFRIAPPITVTEEELKLGLGMMERAFASTPGTQPLYDVESDTSSVQQQGIGSKDPERAMVYCKVLVHKDSIYRGQIK